MKCRQISNRLYSIQVPFSIFEYHCVDPTY